MNGGTTVNPYSFQQVRIKNQISFPPPPRDQDPRVDTSALTRHDAKLLQKKIAQWLKHVPFRPTPADLGALSIPSAAVLVGAVLGTVAGRVAVGKFLPQVCYGPPLRAWAIGSVVGGWPAITYASYATLIPTMRKVMEEDTPVGVQTRYMYRCLLAERQQLPIPSPPQVNYTLPQQPTVAGWKLNPYVQAKPVDINNMMGPQDGNVVQYQHFNSTMPNAAGTAPPAQGNLSWMHQASNEGFNQPSGWGVPNEFGVDHDPAQPLSDVDS